MKVVINIPEHIYYTLVETGKYGYYKFDAKKAIKNGTPLPKGHGNLVDYEELKNNAGECGAYAEATLSHIKPKIIIEADTESEVSDAD